MAKIFSPDWWKYATAYQVYPRSFCDSNGDGIGDIPGIISRLDYLARLGIGFIWLSPVFESPMVDNGYDIADYQSIAPEFGTLADMDRLIELAGLRSIGIVMDLVVNHTSDRHRWFGDARTGPGAEFRDFYVWRNPAPGGAPPNDLQSIFGGPAWTLDEGSNQYYLHLFSPAQPDLNWENPAVRDAVYAMMNWWLDRGIAGFRMDVIDLIGKQPDRLITADGPKLHDYLKEMQRRTLAGRGVVSVGEAWSATPENAIQYSGRDSGELSMVFQFEHVTRAFDAVHGKWKPAPLDLVALKQVFNKWQAALADDGWNSLFWSNHDLPRAVSKYGHEGQHRIASAKMLGTVLQLMRGTPYVYQGEELGMTNIVFDSIDQFNDLEIHNNFPIQQALGMSAADFIEGANHNGRDNARTPMQWDDSANAGFTTGRPWLPVNPNYREINAASQVNDPDSIYQHYRLLATIRRDLPAIVHGRYIPLLQDHPSIFAYAREFEDQRVTVVGNFAAEPLVLDVPGDMETRGICLLGNPRARNELAGRVSLAPCETFAILQA